MSSFKALPFVMFAMTVVATGAHAASVVTVNYNPSAPTTNFTSPTNGSNSTAYTVTTSQDASRFFVDLQSFGPQNGVIPAANIYFGGNTFVGFEVTNSRAFIPGGNSGYYDLTGTGFSYATSGSIANQNLDISFSVPISFFTDDPLSMGFARLSGNPGSNFTRISLSQSFGYSVAGGQSFYGNNRLGAFTVPLVAAVPEPATWAMMLVGFGGVGVAMRRRKTKANHSYA